MSPVSTMIVSTRRALARRPWIQWAVIVVVATLAAASAHGRLLRVDAERDSWGLGHPVLVATGPIEIGEQLRVELRKLPAAAIPEGAIGDADGLVARQRIGTGEIITDVDVTTGSGPQAMTPDGWLAVPVVESPRSGADLGDHVQVASDGFVLSTDAIVVGSFDEVTLLAVPAGEAPLLPAADAAGSLTLLLKP
jgi:hypothetical protein